MQADADPENWLSYGRNYAEDRFSALGQITADNVDQLGLAWSYDTGLRGGVETTPLVVDGIMYLTGPWSIVYALDARTGEELWTWDPEVPRLHGLGNLYVAGSAAFPTAGAANPTLTLIALTLRLSDHLKSR